MIKVTVNKEKTGQLIKKHRETRNLTKKEFAVKIEISSVQTISRWEKGKNIPNLDNIIKICNYFNINIEEIVDYSVLIC